ncbi:MAG: peptidylprolyl isomerase, partial [bacterium]
MNSPLFHGRTSLIAVYLILFVSISFSAKAQDAEEVIDRVIAVIGDQIILESEVFQNAQALALQQGLNPLKDQKKFAKLKETILQELINQKVLLAKAREDSIVVEAREVDKELENRLQQIIQNLGSEQKLEEYYGYSIRRIRREFRSLVEEGLLVERVKYGFLQNVQVTRTEVEGYFNDHPEAFPPMKDAVEIAHVLREASSAGKAEARALARADSVYNAIKAGAPFDSLAFLLSEDPNTAKKNGLIGWTERGDLLADFENVAFALKTGEVSKPVKTRYGYHIIRLEDQRDVKILTSHILIKVNITPEDEQVTIDSLKAIRQRILAGLAFEEAARTFSNDMESCGKGGYLGWFALEDMPADFRATLDT